MSGIDENDAVHRDNACHDAGLVRNDPAQRDAARPWTARYFTYDGFDLDPATRSVSCHYRLDDRRFTERVTIPGGGDFTTPAVREAARLVYLLAGVSYYKAGAPPMIDLGETAVTDTERDFLRSYYVDGLGEFAFRSDPPLDLTGLEIRGPRLERTGPAAFSPDRGTPLIPFGGGVDSIVTTELIRPAAVSPSLFVVARPGDRFPAIEAPARVSELPMARAERVLDPQILRSRELGFRNGHVPVTGIISAIGVLAAVVGGHDAVVMSNEWSASVGTVEVDGRSVNHQYSKSLAFEAGFRQVVADAIGDGFDYFSMLRPWTELWIAQQFSQLSKYFDTFRSCNRAFHIDPAARLDHWCGRCDKCCFIDLILAPYVPAATLRAVFDGGPGEPLDDPTLMARFEALVGLVPDQKPWECVGEATECRVAAQLAAARPDRAASPVLGALMPLLESGSVSSGSVSSGSVSAAADTAGAQAESLSHPVGEHHIPPRYLPAGWPV